MSQRQVSASGLRIAPLPRSEPPVISADEAWSSAPTTLYVQGTLAAVFADDDPQPTPTSSDALPLPSTFATRVGQALVEVIWGHRPAPQLVRWTTPDVYAVVARRSLVASRRRLRAASEARATAPSPGPRHGATGAAGRGPVVRRARVCEPADGVAEVSLVVAHGERTRAVALRLEGLGGRWVITDLQVG